MFNILNMRTVKGKNSPMVCKFLSGLPTPGHNLLQTPRWALHLLESTAFRK
jgi:hypothetical protein